MRRRQVLNTTAIVSLPFVSGCFGNGSASDAIRTDGSDDDPLDADPESLLLSTAGIEERLEDGWVEDEIALLDLRHSRELFRDADALLQHVPYGEEQEHHMESGIVTTGVWVYADVETARDAYQDHPYQEGWGFETREIAVESIAGTTRPSSLFCVVFRDANVVGGLRYDNSWVDESQLVESGLKLAATMHEGWRSDEPTDDE